MGLKLYPYNPEGALKVAKESAMWRLVTEYNSQAYLDFPKGDDFMEKTRALRRVWYYQKGGKEICAKNGRDRTARLKRRKR